MMLHETPLQNHVVGETPVAGHPPPSSQTFPPPSPPGLEPILINNNVNNVCEETFFVNSEYKKLYFM